MGFRADVGKSNGWVRGGRFDVGGITEVWTTGAVAITRFLEVTIFVGAAETIGVVCWLVVPDPHTPDGDAIADIAVADATMLTRIATRT